MKIGRNDPCHCGSGQKYKKCCAPRDDAAQASQSAQTSAAVAAEAEAARRAQGPAGKVAPRRSGVTGNPKRPPPPAPSPLRRRAV